MKYLILIFTLLIVSNCSSNKTVHKSPEDKKAELFYEHGTEKLIKKEYTQALSFFLKAVALKPKNTKIRNNLAMTYWFKNKADLAVSHLKEAIQLDESNSDARNNLASIYYQQKKYDLSLLEYRKVAANLTYSRQYRTYYNMALIFLKKGEIELVVEHLDKSLKERSDYCPAHYQRGKLLYKNRKFNLALEEFHQSSLGTCVVNAGPLFWKAKTLASQKRFFKAKQMFKETIKKFPRTGYAKKSYEEIQKISRAELLSEKMREENYRYKNDRNSLQSKQEQPLDLETPEF
jgi:Tfp pilus assembly protein PilF